MAARLSHRGSPDSGLRIFLSYRRGDTTYQANALHRRLAAEFDDANVFFDVRSILPGTTFALSIDEAIGTCDVLIALIGNQWLTITDAAGRRRIDNHDDWVRLEIATALSRQIRVIPLLLDADMPTEKDGLHLSVAALIERQAVRLQPESFDDGVSRLVAHLRAYKPRGATAEPQRLVVRVGHDSGVTDAVLDQTGQTIATASSDGTARLWNGDGDELLRVEHPWPVSAVAVAERYLATADGQAVRIWDRNGGWLVAQLPDGVLPQPDGLRFSSDGTRLQVHPEGRAPQQWQVGPPARRRMPLLPSGVCGGAIAPDGDRIALVHPSTPGPCREHVLSVIAADTGSALSRTGLPGGCPTRLLWGGRSLALLDPSGSLTVWRAGPRSTLECVIATTSDAWAALDVAGTRLAVSAGATVHVLDVPSGERLATARTRYPRDRAAAIDPSGRQVALTDVRGGVTLWSVDHDRETARWAHGPPALLSTASRGIHQVRFFADGTLLATAGEDGTARIWRV